MNIIVTALMTNGTIQAKLEPLSQVKVINKIYFLRKTIGPPIDKVTYLILPKLCRLSFFNVLLTPLFLTFYALKLKTSFIISYHLIPYAFFAFLASFLTKQPFFVCQTGTYIERYAKNRQFWFLLKKVLRKAKMICVPGNPSLDYWIKKGIPADKVNILHSTIDTNKYKPDNSVPKIYDFIYIGRIASEKRVDFLLNAFKEVTLRFPDVKLLIVGDGPLKNEMIELSNSLSLNQNVVFAGYFNDVLLQINQSKSIVISSDSEGLPCALMEGMSAGLIPISTKVGNIEDIVIDNVTGFCVDKNNIKEFSEKMCLILELSEEKALDMRSKARQIIVKEHSYEFATQNWYKLLG